jgi:hypothetical protein
LGRTPGLDRIYSRYVIGVGQIEGLGPGRVAGWLEVVVCDRQRCNILSWFILLPATTSPLGSIGHALSGPSTYTRQGKQQLWRGYRPPSLSSTFTTLQITAQLSSNTDHERAPMFPYPLWLNISICSIGQIAITLGMDQAEYDY